ncbi:sensor histidine kinase [Sorangium atrum]|uniref:histidine kinase n=1 Tax=Sorangium atrum TaxID=2995308 RepID=A0ABT5BVF9_9BACT|nr:ATP-binding protein [Sorangium aterium]MDC0676987.1 ATP-binding protein [Sorangium aterium]
MIERLRWELGRIRVRLLVVNLVVLLVPVAGLEFARLYERQLLGSLERDMANQAVLVAAMLGSDLDRGVELGALDHRYVLTQAATHTRTRVRILDRAGAVVVDSHENGPPEGPEPAAPALMPTAGRRPSSADFRELADNVQPIGKGARERWSEVPDRPEVREALAGRRAARTRVRQQELAVFLFLAEPIRWGGQVVGAVYVVRSTQPVLVELYRIRSGLTKVLVVASLFTGLVTLALAWSISRPLGKLSRAAKRIAAGERDVVVPVSGTGEIRELGESFAAMNERLGARLRYISDFAADVAHEFKSPLTSIRGAAELLDEGAADDLEARRRFLRNIELDVARLDRLVSRLLELSRIEASSEAMTVLDLEALVARVVERRASPGQPVELRYEMRTRLLRARQTDLETALLNLVDNAVKFSPPGEAVVVTVEGGERREGERTARISVRDRGPGVPPQHLPRIFDRFFTTDEGRDGTGLGLAIVKSVVEAHGGAVTVESAPGEGASFVVELPVRQ